MTMTKNKLTFAVREEDRGFSAQCIEFPSIITQADNEKELKAMIADAVDGYFEAFPEERERLQSLKKGKVIQVRI